MEKKWFSTPSAAFENFDFEEVHEYMERVGWKWLTSGKHEVPSEDDLRATAFYLVHDCSMKYDGEEYWIESGGFRATVSAEGKFNISFNFKK